ncbi:HU family DNA-binding protein [Peribacillus asahii]|uniref:Transcriptional regulator HU subunit alpha n=1 Tax=Peribacillus asahii TaxID=228899 RepID=A0A3T0KV23_9BACI|nr:HU family DNA-binding protein [Peribacillus asahii]AZV44081.1 transcriptional regulator HU subunit alpha [Peribacillus asahii]USK83804.1 HU family DNA-binding protein [Peribacillus asahii]
MNKESFVKAIAVDCGFSQKNVNKMLDSMEKVVIETLKNGNEVKLIGFMTAKPVGRAARTGRNPHDNTLVRILEKVDVFIKPGENLRRAVTGVKYEDYAK